jgi:hypothetical protein
VSGEKYRPSNGTEGEQFMCAWCFECERDKEQNCPILAATMALDEDDPNYPVEWGFDSAGLPQCAAYVPLGDPLPRTDDKTGDLFA